MYMYTCNCYCEDAGLYTGSGALSAKEDPELAKQLETVQKEVKQLEIDSEHQRQSKKMQVRVCVCEERRLSSCLS